MGNSNVRDVNSHSSSNKEWACPKCGCKETVPGIILDPFCGTGTTLARAIQLERNAIGFDGSKEYCEIANKRIQNELDQLKMQFNDT